MAAAVRGGLGYEKDRGTGFCRCRGRRYLRRDADPCRRLLGRGDLRGRYGRRSADRGETGASRAGDRSVGLVFRRTQEIFRPPPEGGRSASRAELSGDRRRMPHGDIGPVRCRRTFRRAYQRRGFAVGAVCRRRVRELGYQRRGFGPDRREVRRIALCGIGGSPGYRLGDRRECAGRDDRSRLVTVKHIRCFLFLCRGDGSSLRNGCRADG